MTVAAEDKDSHCTLASSNTLFSVRIAVAVCSAVSVGRA